MKVSFDHSKSNCVACRSFQFIQFYNSDRTVQFSKKETQNFRQNLECCYNCGLVRQEINSTYSDANLANYYKHTFRTPIDPSTLKGNDKRIQNARKRLQFISKLKSTGTLLEVGFGDGVFLKVASNKFKCTGLDPSGNYEYLHNYLRQIGVDIFDKPLEQFSSDKKYDIVCSFLVLEHIKNPLAFIKLQIKHLTPKGFLIVEVPDIRNYSHFNSEALLTYEHLYHYCLESLSYLLSNLNLELVLARNKNVSYGFSIIAAFKLVKKSRYNNPVINGFGVLKMFDDFFDLRERYRLGMSMALNTVINEAEKKKQSIAIYGTGFLFNYALDLCNLDIHKIKYLFDDTREKIGSLISGVTIKPLADLNVYRPDVVIIFSEVFFEAMKQNVLKIVGDRHMSFINIHHLSNEMYDRSNEV